MKAEDDFVPLKKDAAGNVRVLASIPTHRMTILLQQEWEAGMPRA